MSTDGLTHPRHDCDGLPKLDINIPPPPCKPPKPPDAIERLEVWMIGSKTRAVQIAHGNGMGGDVWEVYLNGNGRDVMAVECGNQANRPVNEVAVSGDDEVGLDATIHAAIDLADKRGL